MSNDRREPFVAGRLFTVLLGALLATESEGRASSHREAPLIATDLTANTTDVYVFTNNQSADDLLHVIYTQPLEEPAIGTRTLQRRCDPAVNNSTSDANPYTPATEVLSAADRVTFIAQLLSNGAGNRHYALFDQFAANGIDPNTALISEFGNLGNLLHSTPLEDGANPNDRVEGRPRACRRPMEACGRT